MTLNQIRESLNRLNDLDLDTILNDIAMIQMTREAENEERRAIDRHNMSREDHAMAAFDDYLIAQMEEEYAVHMETMMSNEYDPNPCVNFFVDVENGLHVVSEFKILTNIQPQHCEFDDLPF